MEIFIGIRKQYAMLGIRPSSDQSHETVPFNGRILFGFVFFAWVIPSQLVYILVVANGFIDYVVCVLTISSAVIYFVCFAAVVFRQSTMFEAFDHLQTFVDASESHRKLPFNQI